MQFKKLFGLCADGHKNVSYAAKLLCCVIASGAVKHGK